MADKGHLQHLLYLYRAPPYEVPIAYSISCNYGKHAPQGSHTCSNPTAWLRHCCKCRWLLIHGIVSADADVAKIGTSAGPGQACLAAKMVPTQALALIIIDDTPKSTRKSTIDCAPCASQKIHPTSLYAKSRLLRICCNASKSRRMHKFILKIVT